MLHELSLWRESEEVEKGTQETGENLCLLYCESPAEHCEECKQWQQTQGS